MYRLSRIFPVFSHSPIPLARGEKLGHYMLIKMSEILKKKYRQETIVLFEQDLVEQK